MNKIDIDKLTGRELALAIAHELRWTQDEGARNPDWYTTPEGVSRRIPKAEKASLFAHDFTPALSLDSAWELDGDKWEWSFDERHGAELQVWVFVPGQKCKDAFVNFSDFPTKTIAYAVARCRAWYKARQAMKQ